MIKAAELTDPQSCLNRSRDDEPIFVLCARDPLAPALVHAWALQARLAGVRPEKVEEAMRWAERMREWRDGPRARKGPG